MKLYLYLLVRAGVTYLIRMLPLVLLKREITNPFVRSFLYYVPYACLAAMTFPAILFSTDRIFGAEAPVAFKVGVGGGVPQGARLVAELEEAAAREHLPGVKKKA